MRVMLRALERMAGAVAADSVIAPDLDFAGVSSVARTAGSIERAVHYPGAGGVESSEDVCAGVVERFPHVLLDLQLKSAEGDIRLFIRARNKPPKARGAIVKVDTVKINGGHPSYWGFIAGYAAQILFLLREGYRYVGGARVWLKFPGDEGGVLLFEKRDPDTRTWTEWFTLQGGVPPRFAEDVVAGGCGI